ncbi:MAG: hypothetical protein LBN40_00410 [Oscillospiraceae bacterium]|jgi:hypothetical protein|nr:hypothetical protein [Oscillospiraceae bacterium]
MNDFNTLEKWLSALTELLRAYLRATEKLLVADLDDIERTDELIAERGALIARIDFARMEITKLLDRFDADTAALFRSMLHGETVTASLSHEEKSVYGVILDLRSLQLDVMDKDIVNTERFRQRHNEVREHLVDLNQQKKKIEFYSNASHRERGKLIDVK